MKLIEQIVKRFDAKYQDDNTPWARTDIPVEVKKFVELVHEQTPKGSLLDMGCGDGWASIYFSEQGYDVYGIDGSPLAIEKARQKANKAGMSAQFIVGNALDYPYDDLQFDAIFDRGLLHHIPEENWTAYKKGLLRVLKPNGLYYLGAFSDDSEKKGFDPKKEGRLWNKVMDASGYWTYDHFFNQEVLNNFLGDDFDLVWQSKDVVASPNGSVLIHSIFKKKV
ncbi:MAG: Methyltransferase type 11 [Candidatus Magasanikbacteria bacterium GW2011_GWD2_43_18]|uniref:Methyltransferase type 11 n=1 Tax=Candidatus Magasanikbacteria bacterium GW2011_GWE2_42_7 TaxID=1619052 RepID=A0A0G1DHG6_9BACT|nr:MAG: Methyltransferase type 11 [Candidatus Magasanikbacteria bacterium GW2011_GWC2_42_27]KKS70251.1 MAG: Methyltransferase type 11 [Candidatus Magasanikbacteria bacterium GW2011_GWE2_42_7]KKT04681.1 MAG: Methyltransferase type 11 [Candidatus Magasanikbacteria bacterium GW2011_GWD2_43_18]KKT24546.1 MAG: Methyltransferase type 11 [Candidatus Magasanikbacteria bacterium GW2011_GWA2_43_9]HBB37988.1 hypothetical protein [Candidatus Magasanikbacteria bacterium]